LFKGARPTIISAPAGVAYGELFSVQTPNAGTTGSVSLIRPGSVTHNFDQNQRFLSLPFTVNADSLLVTAPANSNLAPPGDYMLFVVNRVGVPSHAVFVRLTADGGSGNTAPVVEITSPGNNDSFTEGDTVSFSGMATDMEEADLTSSLSWNSSRDTLIGGGGSFVTSSLSVGSHLVTASVTDMGGAGATGSASIMVHVTGIGGGTTITLSDTGDSFTRGATPDKNFGSKTFARVKASGEKVSFAQFDVSALTGTVTSAILNLPVQNVLAAGTLNVSSVQASWDEQTITHTDKPLVNDVPAAATSISTGDVGTTIQIDVTGLVQQWALSPGDAFGIALTAADALHVLFDTKEGAGSAPFIEVTMN